MKNIKNNETLLLCFSIIIGSLSQPLLAYSYILLGDLINIENLDSFAYIIFIISISMIGIGVYHFSSTYIKNNIALRARVLIFRNILNKDLSQILKKDVSEYINLLSIKVDSWRDVYLTSVLSSIKDILQIVFMSILLLYINLKISIIVILFLIPLVLNNIYFPKFMNKRLNRYFDAQDKQLEDLNDILDGIKSVKNSNAEKVFQKNINKVFEFANKETQSLSLIENISGFVANCSVALSQISGVVLSVLFFRNNQITIGEFMALLQLTFFLNEPVISLVNNISKILAYKDLNNEICTKEEFLLDKQNIIAENIEINNLNFAYTNNLVFKQDINFKFLKGKKYIIKGESGSGKSSLSKLLLKINDFSKGDIILDSVSYNDISETDIHKNISYITQDPYIFNLSIRDNIDILGNKTDDEILDIIKKVKLEKLVDELGGINGEIDKIKRAISGGEKARVAIARAIAEDKPIIIADEVLANLDRENSLNIENLLLELDEKTLINICHHHNQDLKYKYDGELLI